MCSAIAKVTNLPVTAEFSSGLGPVEDLLAHDCQDHEELLRYMLDGKGERGRPMRDFKRGLLLRKRAGRSALEFFCGSQPVFPIELVAREQNGRSIGRGILVDPDWIDISTLRKWYQTCCTSHGATCESSVLLKSFGSASPSYLVDTVQACLVPGDHATRYFTLSYVWGQTACLKTIKSNLNDHLVAGAFRRESVVLEIPKTIIDAMVVVQQLGERFLWVDALCIVQDDEDTLQKELDQMAAIYANSAATLVAAEGKDANYGLRGIPQVTAPVKRAINQHAIKAGDQDTFVQRLWDSTWMSNTGHYFDRAWTFQEFVYSKRRIIFQFGCTRWACNCAEWFEDVECGSDPQLNLVERWQIGLCQPFPSIRSYCYLVREYNQKSLTYPEDALAAFAGFQSQFSSIFPGGFFCGKPEDFFDIGLLWQPWKQVEKRVPRQPRTSRTPSGLPSWSWIGWHGDIDPWSWERPNDFVLNGAEGVTGRYTISAVRWYAIPEPGSNDRRRIKPLWYEYREAYKSQDKEPPPEGWSRHSIHEAGSTTRSWVYAHASKPDCQFTYPIPVCGGVSQGEIRPQYPFLSGLVCRGWLDVDRTVMGSFHTAISLREQDGTWAGVLRLHHEDELSNIVSDSSEKFRVELAAISAGYVLNKPHEANLDEWNHEERPKDEPFYQFYNVLWITWEGGIAYRKALGRVRKEVWERQSLEVVNFVLG